MGFSFRLRALTAVVSVALISLPGSPGQPAVAAGAAAAADVAGQPVPFGDAGYFGSPGALKLEAPVTAMASTANGGGYWLAAADGGIFTYGNAHYYGSAANLRLNQPITGIAATPNGGGYWLAAADGGIFTYGNACFYGSMGGAQLPNPVRAIAAMPDGNGYWLLPTAPAVVPAPSGTLSLGSSGPAVLALQQRLSALGYWVGTPDGVFGDATQQAVYALQKAAGISADGAAGPATQAALAAAVVPSPRSRSGSLIEVDLQRDLLMVVSNGRLQYTFNTSTGGGYTYTDGGVTAVADTPVGRFQIFRQVDGMVVSSLGELWRPKFFYQGYAVHGAPVVPPYPVSHGCVRVSNEAIDWIWAHNVAPIGATVWVY